VKGDYLVVNRSRPRKLERRTWFHWKTYRVSKPESGCESWI